MTLNRKSEGQCHRERSQFRSSPTWDWDLSNFPVVRSRGLTQAKYTWPCKHWVLPSITLWRHIQYYDVTRSRRQYGEKRMKINVIYGFFIVDLIQFASRRKIINHCVAGGTRESHPRVQDLQHPWRGKPRRGLHILDTRMGFHLPSRNMVIDSINLTKVYSYARYQVCTDKCHQEWT